MKLPLIATLLVLFSSSAYATPVTISFNGVVTQLTNTSALLPELAIGTAFLGEAVYTPGEDFPDRYTGSATMTIGGYTIESQSSPFLTLAGYMDGWAMLTKPDGSVRPLDSFGMTWATGDFVMAMFGPPGTGLVRGTILRTQTITHSVPEPSTALLTLLALVVATVGLGARGRLHEALQQTRAD